jgi:hypothetical protein
MKNIRLGTISLLLSIFLLVLLPVTIKATPQVTNISFWYTENDSEKPTVY